MLKPAAGLAAFALLLAACTPSDAELDGDLSIAGMDPVFWGAKVSLEAKTMVITITGNRDLTGELPVKSKGEKDATLLTSKTLEGDFVVNLHREKCSDGLTENEYAWAATVAWKGQTLKGCAGAGAFPPES